LETQLKILKDVKKSLTEDFKSI